MPDQDDEKIHIPRMGETEILPGGGITESDAVPEVPAGSDAEDLGRNQRDTAQGGGSDTPDMAQPTSTADTTGERNVFSARGKQRKALP